MAPEAFRHQLKLYLRKTSRLRALFQARPCPWVESQTFFGLPYCLLQMPTQVLHYQPKIAIQNKNQQSISAKICSFKILTFSHKNFQTTQNLYSFPADEVQVIQLWCTFPSTVVTWSNLKIHYQWRSNIFKINCHFSKIPKLSNNMFYPKVIGTKNAYVNIMIFTFQFPRLREIVTDSVHEHVEVTSNIRDHLKKNLKFQKHFTDTRITLNT